MSINNLISIRNPIVDAQDFLGIDHDKDIPFFTRLATLAEIEIGSYYQYERVRKVIDIKDCVGCLPSDAVLIELGILGDLGEGCDNLFNNVCATANSVTNVNSNGLFLVVDVSDTTNASDSFSFGYINFGVQNNKIIFDRNHCGDKLTIQYLRFKTDCDGFMEVGQNHVNAIREYIIWKYASRRMSRGGNYIDRDVANMARAEWNRECAHARAQDNELTNSQRKNISRLWHNPYAGIGMYQGLYTTLGSAYNIW